MVLIIIINMWQTRVVDILLGWVDVIKDSTTISKIDMRSRKDMRIRYNFIPSSLVISKDHSHSTS